MAAMTVILVCFSVPVNQSGLNAFMLPPMKWTKSTGAMALRSKPGAAALKA
jgi:hypothetical protein